jgi:hypothetical protein
LPALAHRSRQPAAQRLGAVKRSHRVDAVALAFVLPAACSGKVESTSGASGGSSAVGGLPTLGGGTSAGGFGGVSTGGIAGFGGAEYWPRIGHACAVDAECGLSKCVPVESGELSGEGPAHGYCSVDCTANASVCTENDRNSTCIAFAGGKSYCMENCTPGPAGVGQLDPDKCHGRLEVACSPMANGSAVCLPRCNADSDCGIDLDCNPKTGLCSSSGASGLAIGSPCNAPGDAGTCEGVCMQLESTLPGIPVSACTEGCTIGAAASCGWSGPGSSPADAACLYPAPGLDPSQAGAGDLGYCGQLCDCDDDCLPEYECLHWPQPDADQLKDFFQRNGYCGVNQIGGDAAVTPCGN